MCSSSVLLSLKQLEESTSAAIHIGDETLRLGNMQITKVLEHFPVQEMADRINECLMDDGAEDESELGGAAATSQPPDAEQGANGCAP